MEGAELQHAIKSKQQVKNLQKINKSIINNKKNLNTTVQSNI
jgi:hypothetical protein